ncbi:MAG: GIY-YIG nuclease family protein [Fusobacteriaceae bacterium]
MWYIYVLRCEDNSLYTGIAKNFIKRYNEHLNGKGAKYTKSHKIKKMEIVWSVFTRSEALKIEYLFKSFRKLKKENVILKKEDFINISLEKLGLKIKVLDKYIIKEKNY